MQNCPIFVQCTFLHGQRSKCADLSELLRHFRYVLTDFSGNENIFLFKIENHSNSLSLFFIKYLESIYIFLNILTLLYLFVKIFYRMENSPIE